MRTRGKSKRYVHIIKIDSAEIQCEILASPVKCDELVFNQSAHRDDLPVSSGSVSTKFEVGGVLKFTHSVRALIHHGYTVIHWKKVKFNGQIFPHLRRVPAMVHKRYIIAVGRPVVLAYAHYPLAIQACGYKVLTYMGRLPFRLFKLFVRMCCLLSPHIIKRKYTGTGNYSKCIPSIVMAVDFLNSMATFSTRANEYLVREIKRHPG
ncbi:hypothetical protein COOONC_00851 [Cooperia oncophora]